MLSENTLMLYQQDLQLIDGLPRFPIYFFVKIIIVAQILRVVWISDTVVQAMGLK